LTRAAAVAKRTRRFCRQAAWKFYDRACLRHVLDYLLHRQRLPVFSGDAAVDIRYGEDLTTLLFQQQSG
ncbi:MAG: hypothetical protein ABSD88_16280, partial [Candidatus Korobacteraceae bacterium]